MNSYSKAIKRKLRTDNMYHITSYHIIISYCFCYQKFSLSLLKILALCLPLWISISISLIQSPDFPSAKVQFRKMKSYIRFFLKPFLPLTSSTWNGYFFIQVCFVFHFEMLLPEDNALEVMLLFGWACF